MMNRRQHYRQTFGHSRIPVLLECVAEKLQLRGQLVNLSPTGLCVRLNSPPPEPLPAEVWVLSVQFEAAAPALRIHARLVHTRKEGDPVCGFLLLPAADPTVNATNDRLICGTLLAEQRRERRELTQRHTQSGGSPEKQRAARS